MKIVLTVAALAALASTPAFAAGDAAKGEKVFKKCKACHMIGEGAKPRVGPPLNNIIGATAGKAEGYKYKFSKAMMKAGEEGLVWNDETLHKYLENPRKMVKGTKMSFAGLKKEEDRDNVIAYLETFSENAGEMKKEGDMKKEGEMEIEGEMEKPEGNSETGDMKTDGEMTNEAK